MNKTDKYYTPQWCIDAIFKELEWGNVETFIEPCAGDGRIIDSIFNLNEFADVKATSYELDDGDDYLFFEIAIDTYSLCVTNPPFSLWIQFAERLLLECQSVIFLGRLSMLGSQARKPFWEENPLSHQWVLSKRAAFEGPAANGKGTDNSEYAWFGWRCDEIAKRKPGIYHL